MALRIAVYPGSFDPITSGHLDIVRRAAALFDEVVVAVSLNASKSPLFSVEERLGMLANVLSAFSNVRIGSYEGLTVRYAESQGAQAIIRGLRAVSDFEFEFTMALTNKKLAPSIETVFLMTEAQYSFISSSAVKEVARYGDCVRGMVPLQVEEMLRKKYRSL
ncbi:MAG: pantetheine-phosphate adenylyltransferase [Desulforudis sp.]|jgi:pantetheine-phosphate adenylyltransferase|nr:pantetheine-phosphate adenylyltransferase [Clostridia bacterium]MDQ7791114.1 pantetheine-phosphate adenylyltransferase [Clostridia bacterium]RJX17840.1 MAG: pantetheine-phosphate adenylyltransferase [Desulforudis sp.]